MRVAWRFPLKIQGRLEFLPCFLEGRVSVLQLHRYQRIFEHSYPNPPQKKEGKGEDGHSLEFWVFDGRKFQKVQCQGRFQS